MKVTQSFKSDEVHTRILKMLYAAVYSEVYQNREWRDFAFEEFNSLASVGDFLPRTFNCGGRLFLCFAFNWLVNNGIVQYSDRLVERINRLFYRNEIIWDCSPDMISVIDNDIDGEGVLMLNLFKESDTLERYALQEKMIYHLNELDRILSGDQELVDLKILNPLYICSILYFITVCDEKKIFPFRTSNLLCRINDLWHSKEREEWCNILFKYIFRKESRKEYTNETESLYCVATENESVAMFLFLHGMSEVLDFYSLERLPSPEDVKSNWGYWLCRIYIVLKNGKL